MKTIRMYEQADTGKNGFIYSWILDAPYSIRKGLPDWKWVRGDPTGSYVTNERQLAIDTARKLNIKIESNGTHSVNKAPLALFEEQVLHGNLYRVGCFGGSCKIA